MKVRELIEALEKQDPDKEVCISYPHGDFFEHVIASAVEGVEASCVVWSPYTDSWTVPQNEEDAAEPGEQTKTVVTIR